MPNFNPLTIYIEQQVGKQKLCTKLSISDACIIQAKDDEELIIQSVLKAYKQFKHEKEIEIETSKYDPCRYSAVFPVEACMPIAGKVKDPSMAPDFYRGANA